MRHLFGFIATLCLAASVMLCNAVSFVMALAIPRFVDPRAYLALSPEPRSIFATRRMGLA